MSSHTRLSRTDPQFVMVRKCRSCNGKIYNLIPVRVDKKNLYNCDNCGLVNTYLGQVDDWYQVEAKESERWKQGREPRGVDSDSPRVKSRSRHIQAWYDFSRIDDFKYTDRMKSLAIENTNNVYAALRDTSLESCEKTFQRSQELTQEESQVLVYKFVRAVLNMLRDNRERKSKEDKRLSSQDGINEEALSKMFKVASKSIRGRDNQRPPLGRLIDEIRSVINSYESCF